MTPEEQARVTIDELLHHAGWDVQGREAMNLFDPDIITAEIVEDLEVALEQFRLIAEDLGGSQLSLTD